jgi:ATP-dependent Clp protease ATP-binding subunit ClpB
VRIQDGALVSAATLSNRYIPQRFLPDKAIDLVDEAASRLRIEIDSMPVELDRLTRRVRQLEIERAALAKEKDRGSVERLAALEKELAELKEESDELTARWQNEKAELQRGSNIKEELEEARLKEERHEREGDFEAAARLRFETIPELEKELARIEAMENGAPREGRLLSEEVTPEQIAEVVGTWTGIPVTRLMEGEVEKLQRMEDNLHLRVVGQEEAVEAVSDAVRRARAGLSDPDRPEGTFLFLGPTGVGKTELSKALAEFLFDDENAVVRIDMSEYMEKHSVSRLIGAPPGYVGYDQGGQLTERVRRRPHSIVLLDEVEKAHPEVFNVLLQLFDDGRLTDGQGRTVDFRNTIVIMTSNLGSQHIQEADESQMRDRIERVLRDTFRPEFLNRIDETIVFHPLDREQLGHIARIQFARLAERVRNRGIELVLTDEAAATLADRGYDPVYGARPLKRLIVKEIENVLARRILNGEFGEGDQVTVDAHEGGFTFVRGEEPL